MTRQYIGARYVPKFFTDENGSSEWRDNIPYEALTIVMYLGNSYTSKKPVPIGIDISNREYWALTANYSDQIEEIRQNTEIALNNSLFKGTTVFVGDSYGVSSVVTPSWCESVVSLLDLTDYYISTETASGFTVDGSYGNKFIDLLNNSANYVKPSEVTKVIVCGGMNDRSMSATQISEAVYEFCERACELYPKCEIYIGCIGNGGISEYRTPIILNTREGYYSCYHKRLHILENVEYVMNNRAYYQSDNVHPNVNGSKALGMAITNALIGGYSHIEHLTGRTLDISNSTLNSFGDGNGTIRMFSQNGTTYLALTNFIVYSSTESVTLNNGTDYEIGKIPDNWGYIVNNNSMPAIANAEVIYVNSNTSEINTDLTRIWIKDGKMYLRHYMAGATRTVNQIQIKEQLLAFPSNLC